MATLQERIKERRTALSYTLLDIAEKLDVKEATVQRYESGEIKNIKHETIVSLAEILRCSPQYLMGWSDNVTEQENEPKIIKNIEPLPKMIKVPLLGTIACGEPVLAEENIENYINMPEATGGTFALRCKGDSMINARIYDGDIVYISEQPQVDNGEIAAVLIDDEATLKRVYYYPEKNMLILKPENTKYEDLVYTNEELNSISIIGKAVGFYSRII